MSKRADRAKKIWELVLEHIEEYTVPQYGDWPYDRLEEMSINDCFRDIMKYMARRDTPEVKGREGRRKQDILKMIHLLMEIYMKTEELEDAE